MVKTNKQTKKLERTEGEKKAIQQRWRQVSAKVNLNPTPHMNGLTAKGRRAGFHENERRLQAMHLKRTMKTDRKIIYI